MLAELSFIVYFKILISRTGTADDRRQKDSRFRIGSSQGGGFGESGSSRYRPVGSPGERLNETIGFSVPPFDDKRSSVNVATDRVFAELPDDVVAG